MLIAGCQLALNFDPLLAFKIDPSFPINNSVNRC
jgi:hypothetical protein